MQAVPPKPSISRCFLFLVGALLLLLCGTSSAHAQGVIVTPNPFNFGQVRIGNEDAIDGTITANDPSGIYIENVFVEGEMSGSFFADIDPNSLPAFCEGSLPCYLDDGESISLLVYFYPELLGQVTDNLVVEWSLGSAAPKNKVLDQTLVPLSGTGISSISVTPAPIDFGQAVEGTTVTMDVEIVNEITYDLIIDEIFVAPPGSPFSSRESGGFILAAGASRTIQVVFQPRSEGSFSDDLVIVTDYAAQKASVPVQTAILLLGEGIAQPAPEIDVDPLSLDFGSVVIGGSDIQNLAITNIGTDDLLINSLQIVGGAASSYSVPTGGFMLAPNQSTLIPVTFEPQVAELLETTVRITSNDPNDPILDIPVVGIGEEPPEIDFGPVTVGEQSTVDIDLQNPGSSALNVSISIVDDAAGQFSVLPTDFVVPPNSSRSIAFTFAPSVVGLASARAIIESEAPTLTTILLGEGVAQQLPNITVSTREINFGTVPLGESATQQMTVGNTGDGALLVSDAQIIGGGGQFAIQSGGGSQQVPPMESYNIVVAFTPNINSLQSATLRILSNDLDEPSLDIALMGSSDCMLSVSEQMLAFGEVVVGEQATLEVMVSHTCAMPVDIAVAVQGDAVFAANPQGTVTANPDVPTTLTVTFTPTGGDHTGVLSIDGGDIGMADVSLAGSGLTLLPDLMVEAEQIDFGGITLGRMASRSFVLTNVGEADLNVSNLNVGGPNAVAFQLDDANDSILAPGATRTLNLTFSPQTTGAKTAVLRITSNDPDTPQQGIALMGNAMEIQLQAPANADNNTATQIGFQVPADLQSANGQLFFRRGGEQAYTSTALVANGATLQAQIPAAFVTPRGVQFYAEFVLGGETIPFLTPDQPQQIRVLVGTLTPQQTGSDFTLTPATYRMVSMPLALDDPTVGTQFMDDYGAIDPNVWRMFRWDASGEVYQEFSGQASFRNEGRAAWLITNEGQSFDVDNGISRDAATPFQIVLEPGWSQIGNPFLFDVNWSNVDNSSAVQGPFFFDGTDYQMGVAQMRPWEGYFVFNPAATAITLSVPPLEASQAASKHASDDTLFPEASYLVQLRADLPEYGLRDTQNFIGFAADAQQGRDANDWLEPPGVGRHLRLSIVQDGAAFASVFQPLAAGGTWDLKLDVSELEGVRTRALTVQVGFTEQGVRPDGFDLYVIDLDEGRVVPASEGGFSLTIPAHQSVRNLRVVIGTEGFAETESNGISLVPVDYELEANYPNPFNPETVIRYSLNAQSNVALAVYNLLGQRVRTLVQAGQTSGRYEVRWDGRDDAGEAVASGVYIYRLQTDGFSASRKMLLLR